MKKTTAALALCTLLMGASAAFASSCAYNTEQQSLHMRALQSELMVAALACSKKQDYNRYVTQFSKDLQWQGKQLKSYFQRSYGRSSERQLNQFVTQMANQASRLSLAKTRDDYCAQAGKLYGVINNARPWQVVDYAKAHYGTWHGVSSCDAKQVVAQAQ
jgi:hypothetical protein